MALCIDHLAPRDYEAMDDDDLHLVRDWFVRADNEEGTLFTSSIRAAFDSVLSGFGATSVEQLSKTEKTTLGSFVESRLRSDFALSKSANGVADYEIEGVRIDCKFSLSSMGWMIPNEAHGKPCLVVWCDGETFSVGIMRAYDNYLGSPNQDGKRGVLADAVDAVLWLHLNRPI